MQPTNFFNSHGISVLLSSDFKMLLIFLRSQTALVIVLSGGQ